MVEAQAKRKKDIRAYHDALAGKAQEALETPAPQEEGPEPEDTQAHAAQKQAVAEAESFEAPALPEEEEQRAVLRPSNNGREVEQPAKNASRQDWVDYAISTGVNEQELDGKSRDDLVKDYGS